MLRLAVQSPRSGLFHVAGKQRPRRPDRLPGGVTHSRPAPSTTVRCGNMATLPCCPRALRLRLPVCSIGSCSEFGPPPCGGLQPACEPPEGGTPDSRGQAERPSPCRRSHPLGGLWRRWRARVPGAWPFGPSPWATGRALLARQLALGKLRRQLCCRCRRCAAPIWRRTCVGIFARPELVAQKRSPAGSPGVSPGASAVSSRCFSLISPRLRPKIVVSAVRQNGRALDVSRPFA